MNFVKLANGLIINYGKVIISDNHDISYQMPYTGDSFILVSIENNVNYIVNTSIHSNTGFSYITNASNGMNFMFIAIGT